MHWICFVTSNYYLLVCYSKENFFLLRKRKYLIKHTNLIGNQHVWCSSIAFLWKYSSVNEMIPLYFQYFTITFSNSFAQYTCRSSKIWISNSMIEVKYVCMWYCKNLFNVKSMMFLQLHTYTEHSTFMYAYNIT